MLEHILTKNIQFKAKIDNYLTFLLINFLVMYKRSNLLFTYENMKKKSTERSIAQSAKHQRE